MTRFSESFVPLPRRVNDEHERGRLSFDALGILEWMAAHADRRFDPPQIVVDSIAELHGRLAYPRSDRTLRRELDALKRGGWIDYETTQGDRQKKVFELLGCEIQRDNFGSTS